MALVQIREAGRDLVPIICPLKFVQGYRCSRCPWARLLPECHMPWAVPFCQAIEVCREFEEHRCVPFELQTFTILQ